MSSRICHYYNKPGGCYRGSTCGFEHTGVEGARRDTSSVQGTSRGVRGRGGAVRISASPQPGTPSHDTLPLVPRGVCRSFWSTGKCRFELNCRYAHRKNPELDREEERRPTALPLLRPRSMEHHVLLGKILEATSSDALFAIEQPLSFSETHDNLRTFLRESFRFRRPQEAEVFVKLISQSNSVHGNWIHEDRQVLLDTLSDTEKNGLRLLGDILAWEKVTHTKGISSNELSFQRAFLPLLGYLSSTSLVQSALRKNVNSLYSLVDEHIDNIIEVVRSSREVLINEHFSDPNTRPGTYPISVTQFFKTLSIVLFEYLTRFKRAVIDHPRLSDFVQELSDWFHGWSQALVSGVLLDRDSSDVAHKYPQQIITHLEQGFGRLHAILGRESITHSFESGRPVISPLEHNIHLLRRLDLTYVGPGAERAEGPRHDNDYIDVNDIQIPPTHDELTCGVAPYLPVNLPGAKHSYPSNSVQRLMDIHFRLLREELVAPLRSATQLLLNDMEGSHIGKTTLGKVLSQKGGFYKETLEHESVFFPIYTNVTFGAVSMDRFGVSAAVVFDTPPFGRARSSNASDRASYWESASKKRLIPGGLVALIWGSASGSAKVYLGTITSSTKDLASSARESGLRLSIRISFFNPEVELRILDEIKNETRRQTKDVRVLIESPIMYESIRPFLEALRAEPTSVPFSRYLAHPNSGSLADTVTSPPVYSTIPGFSFELGTLFHPDTGITSLRLTTTDLDSVDAARSALKAPHPSNPSLRASRLDPSQTDAILDVLTQEVSLIQGPPGTGKSYTGVELLRVLVSNAVGPILMIAFTNHALDHMLTSVLDAKITSNVIRLGSRSSDEKIASLSLEALEKLQSDHSRLTPAISRAHRAIKDTESEMEGLAKKISRRQIEWPQIRGLIEYQYPDHHAELTTPPPWVASLFADLQDEEGVDDGWRVAGRDAWTGTSIYDYWLEARDLQFLAPPSPLPETRENPSALDAQSSNRFDALRLEAQDELESVISEEWQDIDEALQNDPNYRRTLLRNAMIDSTPHPNVEIEPFEPTSIDDTSEVYVDPLTRTRDEHLREHGLRHVPIVPTSARTLQELLEESDVWNFSFIERNTLQEEWVRESRLREHRIQLADFERLRRIHVEARRRYNDLKNESHIQLLRKAEIVACTTNGAAKLASMLKAFGPKVLVVEEAGQVLEAHILASLVPSIQHLVLIGDPLQLRPTISNYSLSMDHPGQGQKLYRLDQSLMERLANLGFPMSRLDVQRRMRPSISSLVKNTLYPNLEDHALVRNYPHVKGLGRDVVFFHHQHKESGGDDDIVSKRNRFEALMIKDLVLHLLRQGTYSGEGDIVILCAYLGQLSEIRKLLENEVTTVLDERDVLQLANAEDADQDGTNDAPQPSTSLNVQHVKVARRVLLRTVDNFQGEEGEIIILSLVRNSGTLDESGRPSAINMSRMNATIGFLKSPNRTNVALSRSRQGLIIFGDSHLLSTRSPMWKSVIEELESEGNLVTKLPITCQRHPDFHALVDSPGQIRRVSPDGGCLQPCDARLPCGHSCEFKCHSDDPDHRSVRCLKPCARLCSLEHPCQRLCSEDCGPCQFPVTHVALPCGHIKEKTTCYYSQNVDQIICDVVVSKNFPSCEHTVQVLCGTDISTVSCNKVCDKILLCCGRACASSCHLCQSCSSQNGYRLDGPIDRVKHASHNCGKDLRCGHMCADQCGQDHVCSGRCRAPCRQSCVHRKCAKGCDVACAPCLDPCTWKCEHHSCPLPCGAICTRLPCDARCWTILKCGHRCPSVCGEDCSIQICPQCASPDQKAQVVDQILFLTMEDINPMSEELDSILITLKCSHTFTVETLDGICSLGEYYERDEERNCWTQLKDAPVGITKHPTCPTCRSDITALRYSRVVKRAKLDLLEHTLASQLAQALSRVHSSLEKLDKAAVISNIEHQAAMYRDPPSHGGSSSRAGAKKCAEILSRDAGAPTQTTSLEKLAGLHPLSQTWRKLVQPLTKAYGEARTIAKTRSAHGTAYEAAFSQLYNNEINSSAPRAPRQPEQHAMRMAHLQIGQPKPSADKRYHVEAFWATIQIRFVLAEFATAWSSHLPEKAEMTAEHRARWTKFVGYLYDSIRFDAAQALGIAKGSSSHRQVVRSSVLIERANFETFSFEYNIASHQNNLEIREQFKIDVDEEIHKFHEEIKKIRTNYLSNKRGAQTQDETEWLARELDEPCKTLEEAWASLRLSVFSGTFYSDVSMEERMAVVKSFQGEFTHRGHFYTCPNGHVYVIGDCGGAMQASRCPECGETVGGSNHNLTAGNARANDMEDILGRLGAQPDPWRWIERQQHL